MKTLKGHVILYDAVCPMCNLYTKGFIRAGMLDKEGRQPYQAMPAAFACVVEQEWAVNEIALVHSATGKVYYGTESLFHIIANSFPVFKPLFGCRPFVKSINQLYKFISYNRRVIVPAKEDNCFNSGKNPSFNKRYRLAYLLFTWLITAFILYKYSLRINAIFPHSNMYREFVVCGGQMLWQGTAIRFIKNEKRWDYLGNMMTISFAGALLLGIIMFLGKAFHWQDPLLFAGLFGVVVTAMLLEHMRRTKLLNLPFTMTISWVLYRVVVLLIILIPGYVG